MTFGRLQQTENQHLTGVMEHFSLTAICGCCDLMIHAVCGWSMGLIIRELLSLESHALVAMVFTSSCAQPFNVSAVSKTASRLLALPGCLIPTTGTCHGVTDVWPSKCL